MSTRKSLRAAVLGLAITISALTAAAFNMHWLREQVRRLLLAGVVFPTATGDHAVGVTTVRLKPSERSEPIIETQIWYPADPETTSRSQGSASWLRPPTTWQTARAHLDAGLAATRELFPVIIYAPAGRGRRDDNSFALANLASHGFVVAAIDDVGVGPSDTIGDDDKRLADSWDFSSAEAYERTLAVSAERICRQARKAARLLDTLAAEKVDGPARQLVGRMELNKVGFLGFSFGGAAAAEATWVDARFVAAANLDGAIYGMAAELGVGKPYLVITSDEPLPTPAQLTSLDPQVRYYQRLALEDHLRLVRQAREPLTHAFKIRGTIHAHLSDALFRSPTVRFWYRPHNAQAVREIVDTALLVFFDRYLRGGAGKLEVLILRFPEITAIGANRIRPTNTEGVTNDVPAALQQRACRS